jgi:hypothetical protein
MLAGMPGYLARMKRLPRERRREEAERLLREALPRLDEQRAVAAALARIGADGFAVARYTFDEPGFEDGAALLQFTYHLADAATGARDEIRGSGIARIDDHGLVAFEDVDAEVVRLGDEEPAEDGDD